MGEKTELQIPRSPTLASKSGWLGAPVARDDKKFESDDKGFEGKEATEPLRDKVRALQNLE